MLPTQLIQPPELTDENDKVNHVYGPIGFLMASLQGCGCSMGDDLIARSEKSETYTSGICHRNLQNSSAKHCKQRAVEISDGPSARTFCNV